MPDIDIHDIQELTRTGPIAVQAPRAVRLSAGERRSPKAAPPAEPASRG
ncbi:hypothetical protein [uncultured Amnibacterium sp.]